MPLHLAAPATAACCGAAIAALNEFEDDDDDAALDGEVEAEERRQQLEQQLGQLGDNEAMALEFSRRHFSAGSGPASPTDGVDGTLSMVPPSAAASSFRSRAKAIAAFTSLSRRKSAGETGRLSPVSQRASLTMDPTSSNAAAVIGVSPTSSFRGGGAAPSAGGLGNYLPSPTNRRSSISSVGGGIPGGLFLPPASRNAADRPPPTAFRRPNIMTTIGEEDASDVPRSVHVRDFTATAHTSNGSSRTVKFASEAQHVLQNVESFGRGEDGAITDAASHIPNGKQKQKRPSLGSADGVVSELDANNNSLLMQKRTMSVETDTRNDASTTSETGDDDKGITRHRPMVQFRSQAASSRGWGTRTSALSAKEEDDDGYIPMEDDQLLYSAPSSEFLPPKERPFAPLANNEQSAGSFATGVVRDVPSGHDCFVLQLSPDCSLLAVGYRGGCGVGLLETQTFSLVTTIPRESTVSSIRWWSSKLSPDEFAEDHKRPPVRRLKETTTSSGENRKRRKEQDSNETDNRVSSLFQSVREATSSASSRRGDEPPSHHPSSTIRGQRSASLFGGMNPKGDFLQQYRSSFHHIDEGDEDDETDDTLYLAVGGFDGVVTIYEIPSVLLEIRGAAPLREVKVGNAEIRSLSFLYFHFSEPEQKRQHPASAGSSSSEQQEKKDEDDNNVPSQLMVVVADKDGHVHAVPVPPATDDGNTENDDDNSEDTFINEGREENARIVLEGSAQTWDRYNSAALSMAVTARGSFLASKAAAAIVRGVHSDRGRVSGDGDQRGGGGGPSLSGVTPAGGRGLQHGGRRGMLHRTASLSRSLSTVNVLDPTIVRSRPLLIATGCKDGTIRVSIVRLVLARPTATSKTKSPWTWFMELGHRICQVSRNGPVHSLTFSPDSSLLLSGGYDKSLAVIDTSVWTVVRELHVYGTINTIEFDARNRYLAVGSRDKTLTIYDTSTYQPIKTLHFPGWVTAVAWGTGFMEDIIVTRSASSTITLVHFVPIRALDIRMASTPGDMACALSWSYDGRFLARTKRSEIVIADSRNGEFNDIVSASTITPNAVARSVCFCRAEGMRDLIAAVGDDGYLSIYQLRNRNHEYPAHEQGDVDEELHGFCLDRIADAFVERNLWTVAWSTDGSYLATGGRGKKVHLLNSGDLRPRCNPLQFEGRVWAIDCLPFMEHPATHSLGMAVGTGDYVATVLDLFTNEPQLEMIRQRTVRCLTYHPTLPLLALGDGANSVAILDLLNEETVAEFTIGGRVNSLDFSPCGGFLAVAGDNRMFTIHETNSFKVIQQIPTLGLALSVAFSGRSGRYIAVDSTNGDVSVVQLGPLLATEFIPLGSNDKEIDLPSWAMHEAIYRSGDGPSLLQRYIADGSSNGVRQRQVAAILKEFPQAISTFDRSSGEGCFDTALELRKPNVLKHLATAVVDGALEEERKGKGTILTTDMPNLALETLQEMVLNYPTSVAVEILSKVTFIKVPFTDARVCLPSDPKECGSPSFFDPWGPPSVPKRKLTRSTESRELHKEKVDREMLRTPAVLSLPGLGSLKFLSMLTSRMPAEAFDNDAMDVVLRVMWNTYISRFFLIDISCYVLFFLLWIFFVDWTAASTNTAEGRTTWESTLFLIIILLLNSLFMVKELAQSDWGKRREHFKSYWNIIDALVGLFVYTYAIAVAVQGPGRGSVQLAVITTLFLTVKLVSYLRGFNNTGWLISVLSQNFLDVRGFLLVLLAIVGGFTAAFRVLFGDVEGECMLELGDDGAEIVQGCDRDPFGTIQDSLLSTFELAILGAYEPAIFEQTRYTALAVLTFFVAVLVILVVALNALIAVLGDSYSRVQENALANRRRERAALIVEYLSLMPKKRRQKIEEKTMYFHALLEADADGDLLVHKDDWEGGLNALRKELTDRQEIHAQMTLRAIEQLRAELDHDVEILRRDMFLTLHGLTAQVKELARLQRDGGITFRNRNVAKAVKAVKSIGRNLATGGAPRAPAFFQHEHHESSRSNPMSHADEEDDGVDPRR